MELIVFDLDGTLLNGDSEISAYTGDTLRRLHERGIAYTVATGRTLHGARAVLDGHRFALPQAYKNGVMIWHPEHSRFSSGAMLTTAELDHVLRACEDNGLTAFVFTLDDAGNHSVYHPPIKTDVERRLVHNLGIDEGLPVHPLEEIPESANITHINAIGERDPIFSVVRAVKDEEHLVAYSGVAMEGEQWRWLDLHHSDASKGGAIVTLKELAGVERVICFGDNDNDLSMFAAADECYAPANANDRVRAAATDVIGHHDEEGIARFLRERFSLDDG